MKNIVITTILIAFLVLILPAILAVVIRNTPDRYQPSLDRVQQIYDDVSLSQSFISSSDNLSTIGMSIKNPNLANKKDISLLISDKDGNLLEKSILSGKVIPDGDFVKFKFSPIKDSKNKNLTFTLSSPDSNKEEALEVFLTKEDVKNVDDLKIVPIKIDPIEATMSVSFVPLYRSSSPLSQIIKIYSEWINRFFADKAFSISYLLLIASLIVILLAKWKPGRLKK